MKIVEHEKVGYQINEIIKLETKNNPNFSYVHFFDTQKIVYRKPCRFFQDNIWKPLNP